MNPLRLFSMEPEDQHRAFTWFKICVVGAVLSVLVTLANNERTDQRVREVSRKASEIASAKSQAASRAYAVKLRNANLAGCERDNALRRDQNDTSATLKKFLIAAKAARERMVQTAKTEADRKLNQEAVKTYSTLIAHFHQAPLVNCEARYPDPTQDPPGPPRP